MNLLAVLCEDSKASFFPEAALFMRELCGCGQQSPPEKETHDQKTAQEPQASAAAQALGPILEANDTVPGYPLWNFDIVTISDGPFAGLRGIGIGSNAEKRKR